MLAFSYSSFFPDACCTAWPTEVPCKARREQQRGDLDWWLTCAPSLLGQDAQQCPFSPGPPGSQAMARRAALRVGVCASGASPLPPGLSSVSLVLHIPAGLQPPWEALSHLVPSGFPSCPLWHSPCAPFDAKLCLLVRLFELTFCLPVKTGVCEDGCRGSPVPGQAC